MITIKTVQNIRRGALLTFYNGIYTVLFGIFYLIFLTLVTKMNFQTINVVWQVFSKYNPEISSIILRLIILKCVLIISIGIIFIYLSQYILKKKDKTAWVMLFVLGIIFWPGVLTAEVLDKNLYTIAISFIGWVSFIIGMLIPIRYYLQREYTEY